MLLPLSLPLFLLLLAALGLKALAQGAHDNHPDPDPDPEPLPCLCCGTLNETIIPSEPISYSNDTAIDLMNGWVPFFFGPNNTWAVPSNSSDAWYVFAVRISTVVRIVDAFQPGDRFALYINGTQVLNTTVPNPASSSYTTNPSEAWTNHAFSSGQVTLPPGSHRLTIKVLNSVDPEGGRAFVRADVNPALMCGLCREPCGPCKCHPPSARNPPGCCANQAPTPSPPANTCVLPGGAFTMIKTPKVGRDAGALACQAENMQLAAITSENFVLVNNFAFTCNGNQPSRAWIASWNGDSYQGACLVLSSGSFNGQGAITVQECNSPQMVLCERRS